METVITVILTLMIIVSVVLVTLIMVQQGKGADMGAAFGSGSANTFFGSGGASSTLTKITGWLTVAFFALSFAMAHVAQKQTDTLRKEGVPEALEKVEAAVTTPEIEIQDPASDVPAMSIDAAPDQ